MPVNFADIPERPRDEAFALTADFNADEHPNKVSLSAGVYRDEKSNPWILPSVIEVCLSLIQQPTKSIMFTQ